MKRGYTFNIELNGGAKTTVTTASSIYRDVAAALPALLAMSPPFDAFVWHDTIGRNDGIRFRITEDRYGRIVANVLGRAPS